MHSNNQDTDETQMQRKRLEEGSKFLYTFLEMLLVKFANLVENDVFNVDSRSKWRRICMVSVYSKYSLLFSPV